MTILRAAAAATFAAGIAAGTLTDPTMPERGSARRVLAADLHVHAFPGDGLLPRWELQREAARRGLDAIAVSNHNQVFASRLGAFFDGAPVIVVPAQEVTAPDFHMIAAGIHRTIDWRLSARDAIAAVQAQGGVAIAAHPVEDSWRPLDDGTLRALDGIEAAHPLVHGNPRGTAQLAAFHARVRAVNPGVAPIGSSDFHALGGMGDCRTYVVVEEWSETGLVDAIRNGRTVASDGRGTLIGDPFLVGIVQEHLATTPAPRGTSPLQRYAAAAVLIGLLGLVLLK